jgi:hypothetical protein
MWVSQVVVGVFWREHHDRRPMMRLVLIGRYENGLGTIVRVAARIGSRGNSNGHADAMLRFGQKYNGDQERVSSVISYSHVC